MKQIWREGAPVKNFIKINVNKNERTNEQTNERTNEKPKRRSETENRHPSSNENMIFPPQIDRKSPPEF